MKNLFSSLHPISIRDAMPELAQSSFIRLPFPFYFHSSALREAVDPFSPCMDIPSVFYILFLLCVLSECLFRLFLEGDTWTCISIDRITRIIPWKFFLKGFNWSKIIRDFYLNIENILRNLKKISNIENILRNLKKISK